MVTGCLDECGGLKDAFVCNGLKAVNRDRRATVVTEGVNNARDWKMDGKYINSMLQVRVIAGEKDYGGTQNPDGVIISRIGKLRTRQKDRKERTIKSEQKEKISCRGAMLLIDN